MSLIGIFAVLSLSPQIRNLRGPHKKGMYIKEKYSYYYICVN